MKRKEKSKGKFFSIFIVVIMTMSILGFFIGGRGGGEQTLKYNEWDFVRRGNQWTTLVNNKQLVFDYFPEQVLDIEIKKEIIAKFDTLEVDTTYDVNDSFAEVIALSQYMILQNLGAVTNIYIRQGLTADNEYNAPIIACDDATEFVPVVYFKESNETKVYLEENCVIVEADSEVDFLRVKDRLLYGYFKIIK